MFAWLLIATTALSSSPVAVEPKGNRATWVRGSDLPRIDQNAAVTSFDLMVNSEGKPTDCTIIVPSGTGALDNAVCRALLKRARFRPAKDAEGNTTASAYRDRIVWLPQAVGNNYWFDDADLVVSTERLTEQLKKTAEVLVISGRDVERSCVISKSVGVPKLDELACLIANNPRFSPPITDKGTAVRGVRLLRVGFQPGSTLQVKVK